MNYDKKFLILGMRRSGQHAIIQWLCNQFGPYLFLNDYSKQTIPEQDNNRTGPSCKIISLEDRTISEGLQEAKQIPDFKNFQTIVILRDPYNMFASRLSGHILSSTGRCTPKAITNWKDHATPQKNILQICYNTWCTDPKYRKQIANKIGGSGSDTTIQNIPRTCGGSSFDGFKFDGQASNMETLNRWQKICHDTKFKQICADPEITQLTKNITPCPEIPQKITQKRDTAVVTMAIGIPHLKMFFITRPTIEQYAMKIDADFIVIDEQKISTESPHYEKFQIYELLQTYKRLIWIDCDAIIRDDCPNLFKIVPPEKMGMFDEGRFKNHTHRIMQASRIHNIAIEKDYKGEYFNTGIMVISRLHRDVFIKPVIEDAHNHFEQSYLNLIIQSKHTKVHKLTHHFNRMVLMDELTGEHRLNSYIMHYAGILQNMLPIISIDREKWKNGHRNLPKRAIIAIGARLGDMVCAEPVVRHLATKKLKNYKVDIVSAEPRLYEHLTDDVHTITHFKKYRRHTDTPYQIFNVMVPNNHPIRQFATPDTMHTTDFMSLQCMKCLLPEHEKQIKLKVTVQGFGEILDILGNHDITQIIAIHPGRGWPNKTFPAEYWETIIKELIKENLPVAIIGKEINKEFGTVKLNIPNKTIDLRELLSIDGLIALLSKAKMLISNDSSPIHIAGAFNNYILMLATSRHPDHTLPWRNGSRYHKARALYKKRMWADKTRNPLSLYDFNPTCIPQGQNITDYLPEPEEVVKNAREMICQEQS
jgi:hypothetical protein